MRERCIRIGTTINGAARIRHTLRAPSGHNAEYGGNDGQHQYETGDCYGNGEGALRHAQRILKCLQTYNKNKNRIKIFKCVKNVCINIYLPAP